MNKPLYPKRRYAEDMGKDGEELFSEEKLDENTIRFFNEYVTPALQQARTDGAKDVRLWLPDCIDKGTLYPNEHVTKSLPFNEIAQASDVKSISIEKNMNRGWSRLDIALS